MNTRTKTGLAFVFTLVVIHLTLLSAAALTGKPISNLMALYQVVDGRNSMWIPVFFWAWIPTTIMLGIAGGLVWLQFKYPQKTRSGFTSLNHPVTSNAELHTLAQSTLREDRSSIRRSSHTGS